MTGYGKAIGHYKNGNIAVEIRSLNGKNIDLRIKYSPGYSDKEIWLRNYIASNLKRGKIDISIINEHSAESHLNINEKLFKKYYIKMNELADELNESNRDFFPTIARIPNIFKETEYHLEEEEWKVTLSTLNEAMENLCLFREQEGQSIESDIKKNIDNIISRIQDIEKVDIERKNKIYSRLDNALKEIKDHNNIDKDRYEQEVLYYLEKLDINEEKQRLAQHCKYFLEILNDEKIKTKGKKLSFVAQEIGREINTLGAKAQFSPLQKIVINMKDYLEQIKEQLANVL